MVELDADGRPKLVKPATRGEIHGRQSAPKVYAMNASIYVWRRRSLSKGLWEGVARLHVMPRERSIDIDSLIDFQLVELLMKTNAA
jgi:CMP-N-acetylneuraminic acid synthetase